eukprot:gb/GECG01010656.1/.p1 GENE.gb/GECG01010656.1/~~gb/GECG01010656.1/.p1  ORF type:complete len:851 (+),score=83.66 gb/GECG01010656.1/:1-2553(+)
MPRANRRAATHRGGARSRQAAPMDSEEEEEQEEEEEEFEQPPPPQQGKRPRATLEHVIRDAVNEARAMGISVTEESLGEIPTQSKRVGRPPRVGDHVAHQQRGGYEYRCNVRCPFCGVQFTTKPGIMYHLKNRVCVSYDDVTSRDKADEQLHTNFGYGSGHPDPSSVLSITGGTIRGGVHGQRWGRGRVVGTRGRGGGGRGGRTRANTGDDHEPDLMDDNSARRMVAPAAVPRGFWQPEGDDHHAVNGAFNLPHMLCPTYACISDWLGETQVVGDACASSTSQCFSHAVTDPHMLPSHSQTSLPSDVTVRGTKDTHSYAAHWKLTLESPVSAMDAFTMKGQNDNASEIALALSTSDAPSNSQNREQDDSSSTCIQIWQSTVVHGSDDNCSDANIQEPRFIAKPGSASSLSIRGAKCTLLLEHACGSVTDLHWNPFCKPSSYHDVAPESPGTSEAPTRFGLLGACMGNGNAVVFPIPSPPQVASKLSVSLPIRVSLRPLCVASLEGSYQTVFRWSSHDAELFVTGADNGCVTLWSVGQDSEERELLFWPLSGDDHYSRSAVPLTVFDPLCLRGTASTTAYVSSLSWSWQNTQEIIAGYGDGAIRVWDVSEYRCVREQSLGLHPVTAVAAVPEGVLACVQEGETRLVEFSSGSTSAMMPNCKSTISSLDAMPTIMFSGGKPKRGKKRGNDGVYTILAQASSDGSVSLMPGFVGTHKRTNSAFETTGVAIRRPQPTVTQQFQSSIQIPIPAFDASAELVRLVALPYGAADTVLSGESLSSQYACAVSALGDGTVGLSLIDASECALLCREVTSNPPEQEVRSPEASKRPTRKSKGKRKRVQGSGSPAVDTEKK